MIRADTTNLNSMWGIGGTTVGEGGASKGNDMVAAGKNEVSDESFVAVDDEVAAKLLRLFVMLDQISRRQRFNVTSNRLGPC